jgi:hypothetical protein
VVGKSSSGPISTGESMIGPVPALEPELALVVACLCWPSDAAAQDAIRQSVRATLDWDRFLDQVSRHRVTSLVFETLRRTGASGVPPAVIDHLGGAARSRVQVTMRQIGETARLIRVLATAGIGALVLKGPVLSAIAFEDPYRRDSRDIDLIVAAEQLERVDAILRADGYRRRKPEVGLSPGRLARYRRWVHEFSYYSPAGDLLVEVKDRVDPMRSLPAIDVMEHISRPRLVALGGLDLPTLPDIDHFLYLCAHGSRHLWFRLKWIADIGAMLNRMSSVQLDVVQKRSAELDVDRCLHTALLLARGLLMVPIPEALLARANADANARKSAAAAHKCIGFFGRDGDPFSSLDFRTRLLLGECRMRSGGSYRLAVLQRHALSYAYPLLRPFMRMAEKLGLPG